MEPISSIQETKLKLAAFLTWFSNICIIIAFVGNGMERYSSGSASVDTGIWYETICRPSDGCEYISRKELNEKKYILETNYVNVVEWQVGVTICGVLSAIASRLYFLIRRKRMEHSNASKILIVICMSVGCWLLWLVLPEGIRQIISSTYSNEWHKRHFEFPWCLFFLGLGGMCILVVGGINYTNVWAIENSEEQDETGHRIDLFGVVISILSLVFQFCGHSGNAIRIINYPDGIWFRNMTKLNLGLWYVTYCSANTESCQSLSRPAFIEIYHQDDSIMYYRDNDLLTFGSQIILTSVATICALYVVTDFLIGYFTKRKRHTTIVKKMTFSLIPGVLLLYFTTKEARYQHVSTELYTSNYKLDFPWGLLLLGLASILNLIVVGLNFHTLMRKSAPRVNEIEIERF